MGQALAEHFRRGARGVRRGRRGAGAEALRLMFEGPEERADPDRECAAGADGGQPRGACACSKPRPASTLARTPPSSPAIRSANIRRWRRPAASACRDAARLLQLRGQAMQQAVPVGRGAMAALLGLDFDGGGRRCRGSCRKARSAQVANDNAPGQVVVSGHEGRGRAGDRDRQGAGRASGRCCCRSARPSIAPLMQPAADVMAEALARGGAARAGRAARRQRHGGARDAIRRRSARRSSSR